MSQTPQCFETHEYMCCDGRYALMLQRQSREGVLAQLHEQSGRSAGWQLYDRELGCILIPGFGCDTPPAVLADWLEQEDQRPAHRNLTHFLAAMRDVVYQ